MTLQSKPRGLLDLRAPAKELTVEEALSQSRILVEEVFPYFIRAIRGLTFVERKRCPTMAVDKYWRMYYNPGFVKFLITLAKSISPSNLCPVCGCSKHNQLDYVAGVMAHESWHLTLDHLGRFISTGWGDAKKFMLCADLEINDDIPEAAAQAKHAAATRAQNPAPLPLICLPIQTIHIHNPILADWIPDHMSKPALKPDGSPNIISLGVLPKMYTDEQGVTLPDGKMAEWYYMNIKMKEQQEDDGEGEGCSEHGSGVAGGERPWEDGPPGEGDNAAGMDSGEADGIRNLVAQDMEKAFKGGNGRGTMPGGFERWMSERLAPPKYNWKTKLRMVSRMVINRVAGDTFTTWRRPSRASLISDFNIPKPSTFATVPVVYVLRDTSGSMGWGPDSRLGRATSEAEAIIKLCKGKALFMDVDANVYASAKETHTLRKERVMGGGGTDMRVGIKAAVNSKIKPDIIFLMTDGETPWPNKEDLKGIKLVICICSDQLPHDVPTWCPVVHVDV